MNVEGTHRPMLAIRTECLPCDRSLRSLVCHSSPGLLTLSCLFQLLTEGTFKAQDLQGSGQDSSRKQGLGLWTAGWFVHSSLR